MKRHLIHLSVIAIGALTLTSCLNSDDDKNEQTNTFTYGGNECFNRVKDLETGSEYIGLTPSYTLAYRLYAGEVDVTISNLRLSPELSGLSLRLPAMKFTQNNTDFFITAKGRDLTPLSQGTSTGYLFDSFNTSTFPAFSVFNIDYTITNTYSQKSYLVTVYDTSYRYFGDVTSTGTDNTTHVNETSENSFIGVSINPETMTASILANNIQFAPGKNSSFAAKGLPVTLTNDGYTISTTPGEKFKLYNTNLTTEKADCSISDISIAAQISTGATITFNCDLAESGKYSVSAPNQRYLPYQKTEN